MLIAGNSLLAVKNVKEAENEKLLKSYNTWLGSESLKTVVLVPVMIEYTQFIQLFHNLGMRPRSIELFQ